MTALSSTQLAVLVLLLLLMTGKYLLRCQTTIGRCIRISDSNVEDGSCAKLPETVSANVATEFRRSSNLLASLRACSGVPT